MILFASTDFYVGLFCAGKLAGLVMGIAIEREGLIANWLKLCSFPTFIEFLLICGFRILFSSRNNLIVVS